MRKERVEIDAKEITTLNEQMNGIYQEIVKGLEKFEAINEKEYGIRVYVYKNKVYYVDSNVVYSKWWFKSNILRSLKQNNLKKRKCLKKDKVLYNKIEILDELLKKYNTFHVYEEKDNVKNINFVKHEFVIYNDGFDGPYYSLLPIGNDLLKTVFWEKTLYIDNVDAYREFADCLKIDIVKVCLEKNAKYIKLFDRKNRIYLQYKNRTLEDYDLSLNDFTDKNIAGLDISRNKEVQIDFDKLVKDLTDSNINGYNLNKYKFMGWNLTNTDLRNTGAIVDLSNCTISFEGKMNRGTLFDTDNRFVFGSKELSREEVKNLGIKVYRKEM